MKLYTKPGACSLSDHIALEWIGKPFDVKVMSAAELKQPEYLAINPAGAVPALTDGDWALTQNAAILNYLAETNPESGLNGTSPQLRAETNRWLAFLNADVHPAFHPLFGSTAFLEDDAIIEKTKAQARRKLRTLFERADRQLDGRDWLTGTRSIADPYLYVTLRWAGKVGVDLGGLDHLAAFRQRMEADAGVQRALKTEGLI
ncbi:MAG TPA: glutathione S-transferase N-terminal domain-containing protein [Xanthomonadaceae bacterium]